MTLYVGSILLEQRKGYRKGLPNQITEATARVTNAQGDLESLVNRQADIENQLHSLTSGLDDGTDELIADLMGERHYLNGRREYFEQRVQDAMQRLNTLNNRQTTNQNRVISLTQEIAQDTRTRNKERWGTFAVCSALKFIDDWAQDLVKQQEPIASFTEGTKAVGQWLLEE